MVHTYNEILLGLRKGSADPCSSVDKLENVLVTKEPPSYESTYTRSTHRHEESNSEGERRQNGGCQGLGVMEMLVEQRKCA